MSQIILTAVCCGHFSLREDTSQIACQTHAYSLSHNSSRSAQSPLPLITTARVEWHWAVADAKAEPGWAEIGWTGPRGWGLG